jgi:hypothetical protein
MATNDNVAPIKKNILSEDFDSIVDPMALWVPIHNWTAIDIASIIDISVVSAVGSIIHCAINHNAVPVEND